MPTIWEEIRQITWQIQETGFQQGVVSENKTLFNVQGIVLSFIHPRTLKHHNLLFDLMLVHWFYSRDPRKDMKKEK